MKHFGKVALSSVLALLLLAGCNTAGTPASQNQSEAEATGIPVETLDRLDQTVATMEDYTVTLGDYEFFLRNTKSDYEYQAMFSGYTAENMAEFWDMEQDGMTMRELAKDNALKSAKQIRILDQKAEKAGTVVDEAENTESDTQIDSLLSNLEDDQTKFLEQYGVPVTQMKEMYHSLNLINKYQQDLMDAAEITDAAIDAEYEANADSYDKVTVRHILIKSEEAMSDEEKAAAKTQADELLKRIQDGEEIGVLAAEFSEDGGSKDNNGEYTFGKGEMVKPFEEWAFAAEVGDTGIVESDFGYHVMEMMGRVAEEEIRAQVDEVLRLQVTQTVFEEVMELVESDQWEDNQELLDTVTLD